MVQPLRRRVPGAIVVTAAGACLIITKRIKRSIYYAMLDEDETVEEEENTINLGVGPSGICRVDSGLSIADVRGRAE